MSTITFSKNVSTGVYEAIINGFNGTMQIDAPEKSLIAVYAYINGMNEKQVYAENASTSIINVNLPSDVKLRIEAPEGSTGKYIVNE